MQIQKWILVLLSPGLWILLFQGKVYVSPEVSEKPAPDCSILKEKLVIIFSSEFVMTVFQQVNDDKTLLFVL